MLYQPLNEMIIEHWILSNMLDTFRATDQPSEIPKGFRDPSEAQWVRIVFEKFSSSFFFNFLTCGALLHTWVVWSRIGENSPETKWNKMKQNAKLWSKNVDIVAWLFGIQQFTKFWYLYALSVANVFWEWLPVPRRPSAFQPFFGKLFINSSIFFNACFSPTIYWACAEVCFQNSPSAAQALLQQSTSIEVNSTTITFSNFEPWYP